MTNDLGHQIAARDGDVTTLGAYRRGNRRSWLPGALIDSWVPCARGEGATGVPQPHVYFIQTIGERSAESGSIYCPACRAEVAALRAAWPRIRTAEPCATRAFCPFRATIGAAVLIMPRDRPRRNHCSVCGSADHKQQLHGDQLSRGEKAGQLVYDHGLSFAEAGRRVGVTRQTAYWGWRRHVRRREICKSV